MGEITLGSGDGELVIRTNVSGKASRMGHRLSLQFDRWQARIQLSEGRPIAATVNVDLASLKVVSGQGGVTPLSPVDHRIIAGNARRVLDTKTSPDAEFTAQRLTQTSGDYEVSGTLTMHGQTRTITAILAVFESDEKVRVKTTVPIRQSEFGYQPYSTMLGQFRVVDEVQVDFSVSVSRDLIE